MKLQVQLAVRPQYTQKGKCDFCFSVDARVREQYDTKIPTGNGHRLPLICQGYDQPGNWPPRTNQTGKRCRA